jgi:hypothetical protein
MKNGKAKHNINKKLEIKFNKENNYTHHLIELAGRKINILKINLEDSDNKNSSLEDNLENTDRLKNFDKKIYFFKNSKIKDSDSVLLFGGELENSNFKANDNQFYISCESYIKVIEPNPIDGEISFLMEYEFINDSNLILDNENSNINDKSYKQSFEDNLDEVYEDEEEDEEFFFEQEESEDSEENSLEESIKSEKNSIKDEQEINENIYYINEEEEFADLLDEANDLNEDLLLGDSEGEIENLLNSAHNQSLNLGQNTNIINNFNQGRGKNYMLRRKRRSGNNF